MTRRPLLTVGFVTTCRGRLHHLRETIPRIVAEHPDEIIVVDHDCPQGTADWLESNHPSVIAARVQDGAPFIASRARNIGIRLSTSDILCVIDADILVQPGFVAWIRRNVDLHKFFRHQPQNGKRDPETWGTMVCSRQRLLDVGLYDEAFDGWGGEDDDIYYRLKTAGTTEGHFPFASIAAISHDEVERLAQYRVKERDSHHLINRFYSEAKRTLLNFLQPKDDLPLELRMQLRREAKKAVLNPQDGLATLRVRMPDRRKITGKHTIDRTITLDLKVSFLPTTGPRTALTIEKLFTEASIEAFDLTILPWATRTFAANASTDGCSA